LEYRQNSRVIQIAGRDTFEMRTDAAQFRSDEAVHEMQTPIEPGKQFILDLVMKRERDLGAVWPNLGEINDAHQGDVPARGFERILLRRVAFDR